MKLLSILLLILSVVITTADGFDEIDNNIEPDEESRHLNDVLLTGINGRIPTTRGIGYHEYHYPDYDYSDYHYSGSGGRSSKSSKSGKPYGKERAIRAIRAARVPRAPRAESLTVITRKKNLTRIPNTVN